MRCLILVVTATFLSGCTSTANLYSVQSGTVVRVKNTSLDRKEQSTTSPQGGAGMATSAIAKDGSAGDPGMKPRNISTPRDEVFPTSTFGKYEFKAEHAGFDPLYGLLPRKFNGGYLTLDILFFTPAMFFNLSGVYPYYEFDLEKRVVKYRSSQSEGWLVYAPTIEDINLSRIYFKEEAVIPQATTKGNLSIIKEAPQQNDVKTRLDQLDELYKSKLITKEEYETKRAKIIDGL